MTQKAKIKKMISQNPKLKAFQDKLKDAPSHIGTLLITVTTNLKTKDSTYCFDAKNISEYDIMKISNQLKDIAFKQYYQREARNIGEAIYPAEVKKTAKKAPVKKTVPNKKTLRKIK